MKGLHPTSPSKDFGVSRLARRDLLRWAAAVGLTGAVAGCGNSPALKRNYEFEVSYLVDGRPLIARVVQQLEYRAYSAGMPSGLINQRRTRGEGAVVRVPGDGSVIATTLARLAIAVGDSSGAFGRRAVSGSWNPLVPFSRALFPSRPLETSTFEALMAVEPPSRWVSLTPDEMPLIVRFLDASDPGSAEWVDQWSQTGSIRVVSARARFTKAKRTRGQLEELLPWMAPGGLENQFELGRAGERSPVSDLMGASHLRNGR